MSRGPQVQIHTHTNTHAHTHTHTHTHTPPTKPTQLKRDTHSKEVLKKGLYVSKETYLCRKSRTKDTNKRYQHKRKKEKIERDPMNRGS